MPYCLLLALGLALGNDTTQPPVFATAALQAADSIAAAEFAKDSLGSFTVGIVSGPNLVWTKSYGHADSARRRPATPETVYRIASVSKQFTAVMLLQLIERGRVNLSDPVERFFPEIRGVGGKVQNSASVTIGQLATMTSGLARNAKDDRASQRGLPSTWMNTLVAAVPKTEFVRQPGTGYGYSNIGYAVLGAALARASGESYIAYQQRHIIQPLGMTSTSFELTPRLAERLATGVDYDELIAGKLNYADAAGDHRLGLGVGAPSGGIYSTVGDVARFVSLELGFGPPGVLRAESLDLRDNVPVASWPTLDYGYGLGYQVMRWGDTVAVGHSGNLAGYTSMVLYDRKRKYGVIVLRSAAGGQADAGRLAGRVFRRLRRDISMSTGVPAQTARPISTDRFAAVRASVQRWMDSTGAPSVAVAVAKDGRIVWEEAFGWANREKRIRATSHTMYSLASITKPFTATGLMILAERGKISLDAPANAYLGPGKLTARVGPANDATVRRVLSHTAGLPFHFQFFYADVGDKQPSMDATIARYGNLVFAPGSQYEYSNLGYGVLDHILARISGMSYAEFMRREVFLPLGLLRTAVVEEAPNSDAYAERYDRNQRPIPFYTFDHYGASAIYSSAHDLVRFGMFHLKNHLADQRPILKDETIDLMQKVVPPAASYGLGFSIKPNDLGYYRVFHGGSMPGVNNMLRLYPTENIAFALLTNVELNFGGLLDDIAATLIPKFADSLRRERALATRPTSPPNTPFSPSASLVGDWIGAIHTWERSLDLTLSIGRDGIVMAKVGDQAAAQVQRPRFQNGRFIGAIDGRIPTADAGRRPHSIVLNLTLDQHGALTGQATALATGDVSYFALSSFAELRKKARVDLSNH